MTAIVSLSALTASPAVRRSPPYASTASQAPPAPSPRSNRPPLMTSRVAADLAISGGCRRGRLDTSGKKRIRSVRATGALSNVHVSRNSPDRDGPGCPPGQVPAARSAGPAPIPHRTAWARWSTRTPAACRNPPLCLHFRHRPDRHLRVHTPTLVAEYAPSPHSDPRTAQTPGKHKVSNLDYRP